MFLNKNFSASSATSSDQCCLSLGIDNSCVHCSFQPSYHTSNGWATRPVMEKPKFCAAVWSLWLESETGRMNRQVKDRTVGRGREWDGLAEGENLMGKRVCSSDWAVVSLTYLLCAPHETFSCSLHFFPVTLSCPLFFLPLSRFFPPSLVINRLLNGRIEQVCFLFERRRSQSEWYPQL